MEFQKGSALVTVVGLSIVLTLAAGSLLGAAAVSQGEEDAAWKRVRCFHDLESGMMLGAGWLKNAPDWTGFSTFSFAFPSPLTSPNGNGCPVTVTVTNTAPDMKTIRARHEDGANSITLEWEATATQAALPRNVTLSNWRAPIPAEAP